MSEKTMVCPKAKQCVGEGICPHSVAGHEYKKSCDKHSHHCVECKPIEKDGKK